MNPSLPKETKLYADLPGYCASGDLLATILMQYAITTARPDIMIIKDGNVHLIELTHSSQYDESNKKKLQIRTREKTNYLFVLGDLDARRVLSRLTALEIGALGHSLQVTNIGLKKLLTEAPKQFITHLLDGARKVANLLLSKNILCQKEILMTVF